MTAPLCNDPSFTIFPLQEIRFVTKKNRELFAHLKKVAQNSFVCEIAILTHNDPFVFSPVTTGQTSAVAYQNLVDKIAQMDANDAIIEVNNPCNTEFVPVDEQKRILGPGVVVKVNGQ